MEMSYLIIPICIIISVQINLAYLSANTNVNEICQAEGLFLEFGIQKANRTDPVGRSTQIRKILNPTYTSLFPSHILQLINPYLKKS